MLKTSTYLIAIVVLGVGIISLWIYQKYIQPEDLKLLTFTVERGHLDELVKARGELVPEQEIDLGFPFSGFVEEIYVREGQILNSGEPLMKIQTTDFELQLRETQAQLQKAKANIQSARAQSTQAESATDVARSDLERYRSALERESSVLSEMGKGTREEEIQIAQTHVSNAEQNLEDLRKELKNTQDKVEQNLTSLIRKSVDTVQQASVTVSGILSHDLQDIIYPIRYPAEKTCRFQISGVVEESPAQLSCSIVLQSSEDLVALVNAVSGDISEEETLHHLEAAKTLLEKTRDFLRQVLTVVNSGLDLKSINQSLTDAQLTTFKISITSAQAQIEQVVSQVTSDYDALQNQKNIGTSLIDSAQTQVNLASNTLAIAKDELYLKQADTLPEKLSAQASSVQQAEAQINSQESIIKQAEANQLVQQALIQQAEADLAGVQAQVEQVQENIRKSTLLSPLDSLQVVKIWFEKGELFNPGTSAISLTSTQFQIQADISELEIGRINEQLEPEVRISIDAFPNLEFEGKVLFIEPLEVLKDEDRYYRLNASVDTQESTVRAGMSADLSIVISSRDNVLIIPELAVTTREDGNFTSVLENGQLKEIEIQTGVSNGESVEVISGLEEGQEIAISSD
ncbi:MAG: efflux RND transporter periplasmic adaptor subunit [bacterium]|nr:efflux RND transporter periplasmic adaptor subunit [bacterium]